MKIAICDDYQELGTALEQVLTEAPVANLECEVYLSGDSLLTDLLKGEQYHIYFMDIEMKGSSGIETANRIREMDKKAVIIFMTSHKEYVYDVFESLPFRFLIKPLDREQVVKTLIDAVNHINDSKRLFFFKQGREMNQAAYEDILYFEGHIRKVAVQTTSGAAEFYQKISDVLKVLDENYFCRVHTSYIINMDHIRSINEIAVQMTDGKTIPISKAYRKEVKAKHLKFIALKSGG